MKASDILRPHRSHRMHPLPSTFLQFTSAPLCPHYSPAHRVPLPGRCDDGPEKTSHFEFCLRFFKAPTSLGRSVGSIRSFLPNNGNGIGGLRQSSPRNGALNQPSSLLPYLSSRSSFPRSRIDFRRRRCGWRSADGCERERGKGEPLMSHIRISLLRGQTIEGRGDCPR